MRVLAAVAVLAVLATSERSSRGVAKGWILVGPPNAYTFRIDGVEKHSGRGSGLLECTTSEVNDFGSLIQTIRADTYRGRRVRLSGYLRTREVEESARMWMRVDSPDRSPIAMDNMAERPIRGNTEWSRYEIVLDVPAGAVQIGLGAILGGQGHLWVDDLNLELVGEDVATTDMHLAPDPFKTEVSPQLPRRPVNAGFEE